MNTPSPLTHRDAVILVSDLGMGRRRLTIEPRSPALYVHRATWDTAYPDDLLRLILESKGPGYLCDEIRRDEDPSYIRPHLCLAVEAHIDPRELANRRVLDFGCGAGASTVILSRLLPESDLVGVELSPDNLRIARARAEFHGLQRTTFHLSPAGDRLPDSLGRFRAVVLSAVFEHLLPAERRTLLPLLWGLIEPGGLLILDETPARWFPVETHTSGLPLINYLPDRLAELYARTCSRRIPRRDSWDMMRRNGIRGGSLSEILRLLPTAEGRPQLLPPARLGIRDRVELWYRGYSGPGAGGWSGVKRRSLHLLRVASKACRTPLVPYLSIAIRKTDVGTPVS